jgi:hypothetical protein
MYSKKKIESLISKQAPEWLEDFSLDKWKINFYVEKSKSRKLKQLGVKYCGLAGLTYLAPKSADIIIFYDNIKNEKDALSTILHELLHCLMFSLSGLVTIREGKAAAVEERIVSILEKFYLKYLKRLEN